MEKFFNIWLPIGAFFISIISLLISLSNFYFVRKFEAAKKRTELLSNLLATLAIMKNKRDQLFLVNKICEGCPESQAESICSKYDQKIKGYEDFYQELEQMTNISDPIKVENAIAEHKSIHEKVISITNEIDTFIEKIKNCDRRITEKK